MSGARKFFEKLQHSLGGGSGSSGGEKCRFEEITFPDRNETKKLTRSRSGRYKQFQRSRTLLTENTFVPPAPGSLQAQEDDKKKKNNSAPATVSEKKQDTTSPDKVDTVKRPLKHSGSNVSAMREKFELSV